MTHELSRLSPTEPSVDPQFLWLPLAEFLTPASESNRVTAADREHFSDALLQQWPIKNERMDATLDILEDNINDLLLIAMPNVQGYASEPFLETVTNEAFLLVQPLFGDSHTDYLADKARRSIPEAISSRDLGKFAQQMRVIYESVRELRVMWYQQRQRTLSVKGVAAESLSPSQIEQLARRSVTIRNAAREKSSERWRRKLPGDFSTAKTIIERWVCTPSENVEVITAKTIESKDKVASIRRLMREEGVII